MSRRAKDREDGRDELNEKGDDCCFPNRRRGCLIRLDGGSGLQGRFSFVSVSVILPDSCADAIAGATSLAILDHVDRRVVVQRVWDDEKLGVEDEREMAVSCRLQEILGRTSPIRQYLRCCTFSANLVKARRLHPRHFSRRLCR